MKFTHLEYQIFLIYQKIQLKYQSYYFLDTEKRWYKDYTKFLIVFSSKINYSKIFISIIINKSILYVIIKKYTDEAPLTDLLPDINSALAWVQLKEFARNEKTRLDIFNMYQHSCMIGRHKTFFMLYFLSSRI